MSWHGLGLLPERSVSKAQCISAMVAKGYFLSDQIPLDDLGCVPSPFQMRLGSFCTS